MGRSVLHDQVDGRLVVAAVCGVVALGGLASIVIETAITGDDPTTVDAGESAAVYALDEGDCFDDGPSWTRDAHVTVVACSDPHDSELVAIESFSTFGGYEMEEVTAEAEDECSDEFAEYVADLPDDAGVVLRLYHPASGRRPLRASFGERRWVVGCVAWSANGRFGG